MSLLALSVSFLRLLTLALCLISTLGKAHNLTGVAIKNLTYYGKRLNTTKAAKVRTQDAEVVIR